MRLPCVRFFFFCSSFSIQCCVFFCARAQCTIFTCANSTINLVQCWEGLFSTNQSVQFASAFVLPIPYNQPNEKETKQTRALCFVHSVRFATANDNVMKSHLSFLEFLLHTRSWPQAKARLQSIFPIPICVRNAFHFCPSPNRCSIRSKSFCVYFILLCMVFCFHIHFAMHSPLSELKSSEAFCCCWCKSADSHVRCIADWLFLRRNGFAIDLNTGRLYGFWFFLSCSCSSCFVRPLNATSMRQSN